MTQDHILSPGGTDRGATGVATSVATGVAAASGRGGSRRGPHGEAGRRGAVPPGLAAAVPHDLAVDGAGDAVVDLGVELGELVGGVDGGVGDVPDGGGLDDVLDDELADGLVLGDGLGAVDAADVLDVSASVLVASVVASLGGHLDSGKEKGAIQRVAAQSQIAK